MAIAVVLVMTTPVVEGNAAARKLADLCHGELNEFIRFSASAEYFCEQSAGGNYARGRLISKAIVCKSGGNFVTAAISVIKRTSVPLALPRLSLSLSLGAKIPEATRRKIIS